jgi:hypothetical protein
LLYEAKSRTGKSFWNIPQKDYFRKLILLLEYLEQHYEENILLEATGQMRQMPAWQNRGLLCSLTQMTWKQTSHCITQGSSSNIFLTSTRTMPIYCHRVSST